MTLEPQTSSKPDGEIHNYANVNHPSSWQEVSRNSPQSGTIPSTNTDEEILSRPADSYMELNLPEQKQDAYAELKL